MNEFKVHRIITKISRDKQMKQKKKKPFWFWILMFFLGIFMIGAIAGFVFLLILFKDLPSIDDFGKLNFAQSTLILDRQGNELYSIHGEENRKVIPLQEIPDDLVKATLAIEDAQFFEHKGFDIKGILRSVWRNLVNQNTRVGGSTITQQFIKNTFLTNEKTYIRKLKELILSIQLENKFSKEEIMEMYLNSIPYGSNAYGVESAAETYFAKTASALTLAESTILAALPQGPSYYSPYGQHRYSEIDLVDSKLQKNLNVNSEAELLQKVPNSVTRGLIGKVGYVNKDTPIYIRGRTDIVLLRMQELGYISDEEKEKAWEETQTLEFRSAKTNIKAPHFVMYVKEELEKRYGKEVMEQGGLRVYTTLNPNLQELAEKQIEEQGELNVSRCDATNASLVSIDPKTGQILAMVGSRDYWDTENDGNVNVSLMKRLPGSSFKPFAYAAAFLKGYSPATVVFDLKTNFGNNYEPKNFDGSYRGPVTLRYALGNSLNIPAVKMGVLAGISNVYELAKSMGLNFERDADWYGGSLPLGVAEVRQLDLVGAYSVFANNGQKIPITPILRVENADGNILEEWKKQEGEQVLDPQINYLTVDVLSDASARGPGWNSYLQLKGRKNAIKTGTSNKKIEDVTYPFDAWTIGFVPQLVTGVWAGNNDGSVMNLQASGWTCAAPIWKNYMEDALEGVSVESFEKPAGMKWVNISKLSGLLPTQWIPDNLIANAIFAQSNIPNQYDNTLKIIEVDKISGKLPTEYTPDDALEARAIVNFHSQIPTVNNWEKPVQRWVDQSAKAYLEKFGIKNILIKAPEEYDDVHTAQTYFDKPEVIIIAPEDSGAVSPPSVGVTVDLSSEIGIQKVEYYWDDELYDTVSRSPWKGNLRISTKTEVGSVHTIKVKVYDRVYNTITSEIEVEIASDDEPPHTEIVFPQQEQKIEKGSQITIKTYSYDTKSDIDKVVFYVNDEEVGVVKTVPYEKTIVLPNVGTNAILKVVAFDKTANSGEDEIEIKLTPNSSSNFFEIKITSPKTNSTIKKSDNLTIVAEIPSEQISTLTEVNLIEQDSETNKMTVLNTFTKINDSWNGKLITTWVPSKTGEYEFFIRTKDSNNKLIISDRVKVTVIED